MRVSPPHLLSQPRSVRLLTLAVGAALAVGAPAVLWAQKTYFCQLPQIAGLETEARTAKALIGETTRDPDRMRVYVTRTPDGIYAHSNYLHAGAKHPMKIHSGEDFHDLQTVTALLWIDPERKVPLTAAERAVLRTRTRERVTYVVDEVLVTEASMTPFEFSDAAHVWVRRRDGRLVPATQLRGPGGTLRTLYEVDPGILVPSLDHHGERWVAALKATPFDGGRVRVLSLIDNTATERRLAETVGARQLAFDPEAPDALRQALGNAHGQTVVALGHVENGRFVMRAPDGRVRFAMGIGEAQRVAQECCGVLLYPMGCNSARYVAQGVANPFFSLDAVERLGAAFRARTVHQFLTGLAGDDLRLVVGNDLVLRVAGQRNYRTVNIHPVIVTGGGGAVLAAAVGSIAVRDSLTPPLISPRDIQRYFQRSGTGIGGRRTGAGLARPAAPVPTTFGSAFGAAFNPTRAARRPA